MTFYPFLEKGSLVNNGVKGFKGIIKAQVL